MFITTPGILWTGTIRLLVHRTELMLATFVALGRWLNQFLHQGDFALRRTLCTFHARMLSIRRRSHMIELQSGHCWTFSDILLPLRHMYCQSRWSWGRGKHPAHPGPRINPTIFGPDRSYKFNLKWLSFSLHQSLLPPISDPNSLTFDLPNGFHLQC